MNEKDAYEQKVQAQLEAWDADLKKLRSSAEKADAASREEYFEEIERLQARKDAAAEQLKEIRRAGAEAWVDLRAGVERSIRELTAAMKTAAERFR